ncbi:uncharacterized protein LOC129727355 [Wyeomyia smithii]|uniref:uncharacterized protein LOC129727355 n=1 Tax=Wyeomyia smithii TaxID=174621 RepID=UPI002467F7D5|nr:uncharacterized protein LOC129727355 [Wyeomyia smithii]
MLKLVLRFMSDSVLSRKKALDFVNDINRFSCTLLAGIKSNLKTFVKPESQADFDKILQQLIEKFSLKTEDQVQTFLKTKNLFKDPSVEIVHNQLEHVTHLNQRVIGHKKQKVIMPCVQTSIKQFFERDNLLNLTIKNMNQLNHDKSGKISNYIQGSSWKKKIEELGKDNLYIPFFLYNDDFDSDNSLGAHKGKNSQCGFYLSCPVIPNRFKGKLNSFIPVMFINSKVKKIRPQRVFRELIKKMILLQREGIEITDSHNTTRIYPVLCMFTGDNLSLNYIGGFTTSFSSNHYCRWCLSSKSEMQEMISEDETSLRNMNNYLNDVKKSNMKETGIKFRCPFIDLPAFDIINALNFDPMHDLGEGILPYTVALVLAKLLTDYGSESFSLEVINSRKNLFDYGLYKMNNIPEDITRSNLNEEMLKMSSCEMFTFVDFLPMMIGDLIQIGDKTWKYFLKLRKLVGFVYKPSYSKEEINELKNMIYHHHKMFMDIFGKTLKPKMHHLLHYPTAIVRNGPLKSTDGRRGESKNREIKQYARVNFNRKQLSLSIVKKEIYKSSYYSFLKYTEHHFSLIKSKYVYIHQLNLNTTMFSRNELCETSTSGTFDDLKINTKTCFKIVETFVKVQYLVVVNGIIYAVVEHLDVECFSDHMVCYFIKPHGSNLTTVFDLRLLDNFPQTLHKLSNGKLGLVEPEYM